MRTRGIPLMTALLTAWLALPALLSASTAKHPVRAAHATVQFTNDNREAVFVALLDGAAQFPLGTVEPHQTADFAVPSDATDSPDLRIVATEFSNWSGIKTVPMTLEPGEQVDVKAETPAAHSTIIIQ